MAELRLGNILPVGADNVVVEGKYVKGGYIVVATLAELFSDPNEENSLNIKGKSGENIVEGSLCYCQEDSKFYQFDGTTWAEKKFDSNQADWGQTDTTAGDYIKNKPTFKTLNGESIIGDGDITISGGSSDIANKIQVNMDNDKKAYATITIRSSDPENGAVGDIWFKY